MLVFLKCARRHTSCKRLLSALGTQQPASCRTFAATWPNATPAAAQSDVLLLRDYIHQRLYNLDQGYFSLKQPVVGRVHEPLRFAELLGQRGYLQAVAGLYQELQVSWLTPAEIFQPHYGRAIANYVLQHHAHWPRQAPLQVFEVGGGTGTLALNILDHIQAAAPKVYASMSYIGAPLQNTLDTCTMVISLQEAGPGVPPRRCASAAPSQPGKDTFQGPLAAAGVEISSVLADLQRQRVGACHDTRYSVQHRDAADLPGWGPPDPAPCFIVMTEVLDNLPHDRVWRSSRAAGWQETRVVLPAPAAAAYPDAPASAAEAGADRLPQEQLQPVSDPLIQRCLAAYEWGQLPARSVWQRMTDFAAGQTPPDGNTVFLPTGCLRLLETLAAARPAHHLVAADFDTLPDVVLPGVNAPLVASRDRAATRDHNSYLLPPGLPADLYFPTKFDAAMALHAQACAALPGPRHARQAALKTRDFMQRYAVDLAATTTLDGYNPLLEDYSNTALLLADTIA